MHIIFALLNNTTMSKQRLLLFSLFSIILIILLARQTSQAESQQSTIIQKTQQFINKLGFRLLVNQGVLKVQIKLISSKLMTKAMAKATAKKVPLLGAVAGLGFALGRLFNGEPGKAAAQLSSGIVGATGIGMAGSVVIDMGILIADIIDELESQGFIRK